MISLHCNEEREKVMQRYNLYRGSEAMDGEKGELVMGGFTTENLFASTVPSELYDLTVRCIKYIEETIEANGIEVVFKNQVYFVEKAQ